MPYKNQTLRNRLGLDPTNRHVKGDYGEMLNRLDYRAKGYEIRNSKPVGAGNIEGTRMKPIDVIAHDPKSGMDVLMKPNLKVIIRYQKLIRNLLNQVEGKVVILGLKKDYTAPCLLRILLELEEKCVITLHN